MKLEKLIIAFLAAYIIYCFISKENYAFDEPGVIFSQNDPNLGYIDIYHREGVATQATGGRQRQRTSTPVTILDRLEFTDNISTNRNVDINGLTATINNFTSRIPKSVTAYGVNYDRNGNIEYYRLMSAFDTGRLQFELKPGNRLVLKNLSAASLGSTAPRDGTPIRTARLVFNF